MITMVHTPSGKRMSLKDSEAVKKRILERCGWSELVDIPEEEEQPNDGYVEQSPQATQKPTEATKPAPKHRRPKKVTNDA